MYFRNEHHRQAFREGMKKTNRKDKETVSAVYLLSAEPCLWQRAKQASIYGKILLNNVRLSIFFLRYPKEQYNFSFINLEMRKVFTLSFFKMRKNFSNCLIFIKKSSIMSMR